MSEQADVLMIDDDEAMLEVARHAFQRHELAGRLTTLSHGEQALELLFSGGVAPRLVLLDLQMPGLDGRGVLRRLRADERTRHLPVVVMSGSESPDDVAECYRLGANSFVAKRFGSGRPGEELIDVVRYWIGLNVAPPMPPEA